MARIKKNTARRMIGGRMSVGGKAPMKPMAIKMAARKLEIQVQAQAEADQQSARPKRHRFKPGPLTIQEIRRYQDATVPILRKKPFVKLVKELSRDFKRELRYQSISMNALAEASEAFLVKMFEEADLCAKHGKRKEITPKDIKLARRLRGERS